MKKKLIAIISILTTISTYASSASHGLKGRKNLLEETFKKLDRAGSSYERQKIAQNYLDQGGDINAIVQNKSSRHIGQTILHHLHYDPNLIKMLIAKNANVNILDKNGNTILHAEVFDNREESVHLLLEARANINSKNRSGASLLIAATWASSNVRIVESLLEHKADTEEVDNSGNSPFYYASKYRQNRIQQALEKSRKFESTQAQWKVNS